MKRIDRRTLLAALATTGVSALSGCSGLLDDGEEADDDNETGADGEPTGNETDGSDDSATNETDDSEEESTDEPETAEELALAVVEDMAAGEFERAGGRTAADVNTRQMTASFERFWMGMTAVGGEYREAGEVSEETVQGYDAADVPLSFERAEPTFRALYNADLAVIGANIVGEYAAPDYVDAESFEERTVSLDTDGCPIEGTLTVPRGEDDVPGVVLVHGSGPSDRDATVGANKPFRDIAEGLATRGIAVLRYDKRTYACNVDPADATFDRITIDDSLAAADRLREVDPVNDVFVAGHSLGGMAVPEIASRADDLAGAVALAAPARRLEELFVEQYEYLVDVGEHTLPQNETQLQAARRMAEQIRNDDYDVSDALFQESGAFWESIDDYDQVATARDVETPLYFLQGERDYQVPPEDFETWREELSGQSNVAFDSYERANHALMPGEGTSVPEAYMVPNSVQEQVVADIAAWIDER